MNPDCVGLVGGGTFGTALAKVVGDAGRDVVLWSRTAAVVDEINRDHTNNERMPDAVLPDNVRATNDPKELCDSARFLVIALRSDEVRDRAAELGPLLSANHLVVHAIGGLAEGAIRVSEVLGQEIPALRLGVLAGPALARDLVFGRYASMVVASEFDEVTSEALRLLSSPPELRLYTRRDLAAVELSAALAEAYSLALGLADSLQIGIGPRSVLVTRAVAEGARVLSCAGTDPAVFSGLSGLGNLLVRTPPDGSYAGRSYRYGLALGKGEPVSSDREPEGVRAAKAALELTLRSDVHAPLLHSTVAVLRGEMTAAQAAAAAADTVATTE